MSFLVRRLLDAVGSPNVVRIPSAEDTSGIANQLMMGYEGPTAYDLENADFILSFGCGLIEGWGAPGRVINAWGLWHSAPLKGKVTIVQIESRASKTASKADQWLAPRSGTEAALALGLAHVIIREGLYEKAFVDKYTFGFEDWRDTGGKRHLGFRTLVLEKYGPGNVANITGLNARDIVTLAKTFSRSKRPIALMGKGKGALNGSLYEFMAVQSLNALVGNINQPGGVLIHEPLPLSPWPDVVLDAVAQEGLRKTRIDQAGSVRFPFSRSLINNLADAIMEYDPSPVDTLLIFSANPAHNLPDGGIFRSAMKKIPYIVSFSPYKDDSSYMADLILPDHNYLEKTNDVVWPTGLQYPLYGLSQPVIESLYDTRNSGDVILKLAQMIGEKVGSSFPWKNFGASIKARARGLFESGAGLTHYDDSSPVWKVMAGGGSVKSDDQTFDEWWKKLQSGGFWYRPTHDFGNWGSIFKTPSGKFEFFSRQIEQEVQAYALESSPKSALQNLHIDAQGDEVFMPHYEPAHSDADEKEYPLMMIPYELINLSNGWLPNPPYLYKTLFDHQLRKEESFAEMNPSTAAQYGLKQGDRIVIQSQNGKLKVLVNLFEGAMPGIVYLPLGFGHGAYDAFQRNKGANPNEIIAGGKDPLSGLMIWWNTRVKLVKT
jgi:anaerobic selenocysteine-containing dehydrogenase